MNKNFVKFLGHLPNVSIYILTVLLTFNFIFIQSVNVSDVSSFFKISILLISSTLISTIFSFAFMYKYFDLDKKLDQRRRTLNDYEERITHIFDETIRLKDGYAVPDKIVREFEELSSIIRIVSPDLVDDEGYFKKTIIDNIAQGKIYQYIIPDEPAISNKMNEFIENLSVESNIVKDELPIFVHRLGLEFPIIKAFGIYKISNQSTITPRLSKKLKADNGDIVAVMEISHGPDDENTHIRLTERESYALNAWFDHVFSEKPG